MIAIKILVCFLMAFVFTQMVSLSLDLLRVTKCQ